MARNQRIGAQGEDLAVAHLERCGLEVVDRNWRCPRGEVDIVAMHSDTLVFVEVKTRSSLNRGYPSEAVTVQKLAHMRAVALDWIGANRVEAAGIRFDVVGIVLEDPPVINWLRGVSV